MFIPISDWVPAFLLTVLIETPIVLALVRGPGRDPIRLVVLIVFANLATHLAAWYVLSQVFLVGSAAYTAAAESWAVAAETVFYWAAIRDLSGRRALAIAVAANLASFAAGRLAQGVVLASGFV